jgi:hypothetical protein
MITVESSRMKVEMPDRTMVMEGMTAGTLAMETTGVMEMVTAVTEAMTGMLGTPPAAKRIRRRKRRKRKKNG